MAQGYTQAQCLQLKEQILDNLFGGVPDNHVDYDVRIARRAAVVRGIFDTAKCPDGDNLAVLRRSVEAEFTQTTRAKLAENRSLNESEQRVASDVVCGFAKNIRQDIIDSLPTAQQRKNWASTYPTRYLAMYPV